MFRKANQERKNDLHSVVDDESVVFAHNTCREQFFSSATHSLFFK